eukprot:602722-Amphidinium_carterae.1
MAQLCSRALKNEAAQPHTVSAYSWNQHTLTSPQNVTNAIFETNRDKSPKKNGDLQERVFHSVWLSDFLNSAWGLCAMNGRRCGQVVFTNLSSGKNRCTIPGRPQNEHHNNPKGT